MKKKKPVKYPKRGMRAITNKKTLSKKSKN